MIRPYTRAFLLSTLAAGVLSAAPYAFAQESGGDVSLEQRQRARRQAAVQDALQQVQQARLAYTAKRYSEAVECYRNALAVIPKAPATETQVTFIKDSLSDALIAKAMDYRKVGRTDEARQFLMEAIELSPNNKLAKRELARTNDPERTNPALTPEHVGQVHEVNRLLTLAQGYYGLGNYDEAIKTFQNVLRIDQYNAAAQRGIEQCDQARSRYFSAARDAYRAKALNDVDALYDIKSDPDMVFEPLDGAAEQLANQLPNSIQEAESAFHGILSEIMLPQVRLEDATIDDVVGMLRNQILQAEAAAETQGRKLPHINVIPYFGTPDSKGYKEIQEKRVSLDLNEISVTGLLDVLTNQLGISYYYDPNGLVLTYSGKDFGPMVERTFMVPPHFFDPSEDEEAYEDEDNDGGFGRMRVGRVNPKATLAGHGISFPEGATVRYSPSERLLHVRNTVHNVNEIAELLNIPFSQHRAVVLSVIMVQVSEDDLRDLGFEWLFNVSLGDHLQGGGGNQPNGTTTAANQQAASAATGAPVAMFGLQDTVAPGVTDGLRSGSNVLTAGNMDRLISAGSVFDFSPGSTSKSPSIFGFRGIWNVADVTMIMRGLSQKTGVDILQRPRIVFAPEREEQVSFANVREVFFPSGYEAPEIETVNINLGNDNNGNNQNGQAVAATPAHPIDFTRFGISEDGMNGFGTIIQVHDAEINDDGSIVTLSLTSTMNEFEGFVNWGQPIQSALWNGNRLQMIRLSDNQILQPVIKRYCLNTKVSIASGSVMVLGGMKEARDVRYEDKVPVLGDLPLVGRLFRSEGSSKKRKAVIYFAKVDVVDPTGRDVSTGQKPTDGVMEQQ